jgi:aspartyl protease family protein
MSRVVVLFVALIAVTGLIIWLASGSGQSTSAIVSPHFIYTVTLLVVVLSSVILHWRGNLTDAAKYAVIWLGLFAAVLLAYSYRGEVKTAWQRIAGEVNPALPVEHAAGEVTLRPAEDGHFYADVQLNGVSVRMLADTGASTIALSEEDARRVGFDVGALQYTAIVSTANGQAPAAEVVLQSVRVGSIERRNVRALVGRNLGSPLLGMNFFNTLSKFTMDSNALVLKD